MSQLTLSPHSCQPLRPCRNTLRPFKALRNSGRASASRTICAAVQDQPRRRDALLAAGGAILLSTGGQLLAPQTAFSEVSERGIDQKRVKVQYLSAIAKNSQRQALKTRAEKEFKKGLKAEDAPSCLRLVLHDAATYDIETGAGGLNGSIVLPEELNRPENKGLKSTVDKLKSVKEAVDEGSKKYGIPPLSWADTLVLGAKVSAELSWVNAKKKRLGAGADIDTISSAFGADFPLKLGRVDVTEPDPAGRFPDPNTASPAEIQKFLNTLGTKAGGSGGLFAPKPLFWERPAFVIWTAAQPDPVKAEQMWADSLDAYKGLKLKYDRSRDTVTRTDYEVDFITFFDRLTSLGAKVNADQYLVDQLVDAPRL